MSKLKNSKKGKTRGSQEPISLTWDTMQLNGSNDIYLTWPTTWKTHQNIPRNNFLLKSAKMQFTQYGGHFEKKLQLRNFFSIVPSCSPHQFTPRYQFSLKSDKVDIFAIWRPFWKKKMLAWNKIWIVSSCSPRQITPRYQFSLKSDKADIYAIWQPFWKKMVAREIISIVPSRSPHHIQHVPVGINSLAIILFRDIKSQSPKNTKKQH